MKNKKRLLVVVIVLAICFRLWLLASSNWRLIINSYYDSHLQINEAISLLKGHWLGAYNKFTLCKNISYPVFLFVLNILHLPYYFGMGLLITFSSGLFVKAIKPVCKNKILQCIIFIFIMFNPVGFNQEALYHYRNSLIPWVVLIVISCITGIYLRKDKKIKEILPFGIIGLFFTGFYWQLREDSIWFLPFILMAFLMTVISFVKNKDKINIVVKKSIVSFLPMLGVVLSVVVISTINYFVYGVFATNDRTSSYEAKVLGQLVLIDDGADLNKDVWVSDKAIKIASKASPTFSKLDLDAFNSWSKHGDYSIWALRDAASNVGYYKDGKTTNEMYKKIYKELKNGFKNGNLKKKKAIKLSDTSGVFSTKEFLKPIPIMFHSLYNHSIYSFDNVVDENIDTPNDVASIEKYEMVLKINLLRTDESLAKEKADIRRVTSSNNLKRSLRINKVISNSIIFIYKITGLVLLVLSLIIYFINMFKKKKEKNSDILLIMTGLLLTIFLNSYLVGLWGVGFNLSADDGLFSSYTTAQTIMIGLFEVLSIILFLKQSKNKFVKKYIQC